VEFEAWHLNELKVQASQSPTWIPLGTEYGTALKLGGPAFTAFVGITPIACAGVVRCWEGRAMAWALLSDAMPQYKKAVHKAVKNFLKGYRIRRLECTVDPRNPKTRAWAERLGFTYEGTLEAYTPLGDNQLLMVRIER
jgi:ribosomal protein S18 acetylase RimI-like enzyme